MIRSKSVTLKSVSLPAYNNGRSSPSKNTLLLWSLEKCEKQGPSARCPNELILKAKNAAVLRYKVNMLDEEQTQDDTCSELSEPSSAGAAKRFLPSRNLSASIPQDLPTLNYTDAISPPALRYCTTVPGSLDALQDIESAAVVGFDIEWRVTYQKGACVRPTAVVQVCSDEHVVVFHAFHMRELPQGLMDLIMSKTCIKAGVNIRGDAQRLHKDFNVKMESWCELTHLAKAVYPDKFKDIKAHRMSLQSLVEALFNKTLDKSAVRTSNWEVFPLSNAQMTYAANDAFASLALYRHLMQVRSEIPNYENAVPIKLSNLADYEAERAKIEAEKADSKQKRSILIKPVGVEDSTSNDNSGKPSESANQNVTTTRRGLATAVRESRSSWIPKSKKEEALFVANLIDGHIRGPSSVSLSLVERKTEHNVLSTAALDCDPYRFFTNSK
ncbi:hypothetical protein SeLEV6574_g00343 [Synchytrium endobioticum]|uniref:3'-5' exonuclease n=1 Tax=Synchytrium endobioticum TaxID=286115 RepID=A0A507DIH2_9FUNG|nr:hypothetical protein SeLEV6574_g00343 [Synchytrium endobioticum]